MVKTGNKTAVKKVGDTSFEVYYQGEYYGTYHLVAALQTCAGLER
jgi:hypothetical protein